MQKKKFSPLNSEQVEESRKKYGSNSLTSPPQISFWQKLWENYKGDALIRILSVALVVTLFFAVMGWGEWLEAVGIGIAVVLATTVSTYSEYSNNALFQKLQEEYGKLLCKVYRQTDVGDKICDLSIDEIVTGDYVLLQAGDKISADGYLWEGNIRVNQSTLNGESEEAEKEEAPEGYVENAENVDFLDPHKVYRGAVVTEGEGVMLVTQVGSQSQFGKLASELNQETDRESPLKVKLGKLASQISKCAYVGSIAIAIVFLLNNMLWNPELLPGAASYFSSENFPQIMVDIVSSITVAIVIIVVAVPEGLPMMIAIVSGLNMKKLLKDNILIRKIDGAETAGSLNILFTDKTGTITKGQMQVVYCFSPENDRFSQYTDMPNALRRRLLFGIKGNTNAVCSLLDGQLEITGGNITERALHLFLGSEGEKECNAQTFTVKEEALFTSTKKYSASQIEGDYSATLFKGAPEKIVAQCQHYYDKEGNKQDFSQGKRDSLDQTMNEMAAQSMRVLAFAESQKELEDAFPSDLTLVAVVAIRDEMRPEAKTAMQTASKAGIQVVMVTGDKKETAYAIAKDVGLVTKETDLAMTSEELNHLSDEELKKKLPDLRVVARALPTDKSRLVRNCQELGLVVGMTGDGVNDAPALKKSDVGFAMGSGSEVSKEAADITILDDNFHSIVKTVLYGRTIYNNIRKFIVFQLTINVSAVAIAFLGPFFGVESPLSVTQMLWVNIVMDTLAALALGGEPPLDKYMLEKPKKREESIIQKSMWNSILITGGYITIASFSFLLVPQVKEWFRQGTGDEANIYFMTGFFAFYVLNAMLNGFNVRTDSCNVLKHVDRNPMFLRVMALIAVLQIVMTYLGGKLLRTAGLTVSEWLVVILGAVLVLPIGMLQKCIFQKNDNQ